MRLKLIISGFLIWIVATVALRFEGQRMLRPGNPARTVVLFGLSFFLVAVLVRRLCVRLKLPYEEWPVGAIAVLLPTLLLDPFSSAFFPIAFPNMAPQSAGVFGGWMLICCAGGLVGAMLGRRRHS